VLTDAGATARVEEAVAEAIVSGRFVAVAAGVLAIMTPGQWNDDTPVRVELWPHEPVDDRDDWDHEVDVDLDLPTGTITIESVGGPSGDVVPAAPGRYRGRVSGQGFAAAGAPGADGGDAYRLRLWPRAAAAPAVLRRAWPGWADQY